MQSLKKAFIILEYLSSSGKPMALSQISRDCLLPQATAHRFLMSLCKIGYVKNIGKGNYCLTSKLLVLIRNHVLSNDFLTVCRPHLNKLSRSLNEGVSIVVRNGQDVVYIDTVVNTMTPTNVITRIGHRVPMYRTAAGRCILATLADLEVREILENSELVSATPNTIVEIDKLMAEIRKIRQNSYAINNEEDEIGIKCIAASLSRNNTSSELLFDAPYAISVSYTASRLKNENIIEITKELMKTRDNILSEVTI